MNRERLAAATVGLVLTAGAARKEGDSGPSSQNFDAPTTEESRGLEGTEQNASLPTHIDTGMSDEERLQNAEAFADRLRENLTAGFENADASVEPDGSISLKTTGDYGFAVTMKQNLGADSWKVHPDQGVADWLQTQGVEIHGYDLADPSQVNVALQDAEVLSRLYQQGSFVTIEDTLGADLEARLSKNLSATEEAETKISELKEAEKRQEQLKGDIEYALHDGENVFAG